MEDLILIFMIVFLVITFFLSVGFQLFQGIMGFVSSWMSKIVKNITKK